MQFRALSKENMRGLIQGFEIKELLMGCRFESDDRQGTCKILIRQTAT